MNCSVLNLFSHWWRIQNDKHKLKRRGADSWIKSEMFDCTPEMLWLCAAFLNRKDGIEPHVRTLLAWGRPVPGYFYNFNTSTQWKTKKQHRKHVTTLLMLQVILAMRSRQQNVSSHNNLHSERSEHHIHNTAWKQRTSVVACCSWFTINRSYRPAGSLQFVPLICYH